MWTKLSSSGKSSSTDPGMLKREQKI
jgi:hypothetical protein